MKESTLLTCTEFVALSKANNSLLLAFRAEFRKGHRELAHPLTLGEWKKLFEQFKQA